MNSQKYAPVSSTPDELTDAARYAYTPPPQPVISQQRRRGEGRRITVYVLYECVEILRQYECILMNIDVY